MMSDPSHDVNQPPSRSQEAPLRKLVQRARRQDAPKDAATRDTPSGDAARREAAATDASATDPSTRNAGAGDATPADSSPGDAAGRATAGSEVADADASARDVATADAATGDLAAVGRPRAEQSGVSPAVSAGPAEPATEPPPPTSRPPQPEATRERRDPRQPSSSSGEPTGGTGSEAAGSGPSARQEQPADDPLPSAVQRDPDRTAEAPRRIDVRSVELQDDELQAALGDVALDRMLLDASAEDQPIDLESRRSATVVKVDDQSVFFSLGGQHEGMAPRRQFEEPPRIGQTIEVLVNRFLSDENLYELLIPGAAVNVEDWSDLAEGMIVEGRVTGHNPGGLECDVHHIRGFIPASQVSLYRVDDLSQYVGQKLACVVTEANPRRRNLVLSHRALLEREREEKRQKLLSELEPGQVREGLVRSVRDFGAFVDLGGVDGLIPISQLSWDRIGHPSEVVHEGQRVKVRVQRVDAQAGKISLSYRDLMDHPWTGAEQRFPVGTLVEGTVSKVMDFGAFLRVAPGVEGLIHISELAHRRVQRVSQVVHEGQTVQAKILAVDAENQRMSLSLKAAQPDEPAEEDPDEPAAAAERAAAKPLSRPLKGGTDRSSGGERFGLRW